MPTDTLDAVELLERIKFDAGEFNQEEYARFNTWLRARKQTKNPDPCRIPVPDNL